MNTIKLKNTQLEDLEDLILKVENNYHINLDNQDLSKVKDFEELNCLILNKLNFEDDNLCTSQLAFYRLRAALQNAGILEENQLKLDTKLKEIFPRKSRREYIKYVENKLGFELDILKPHPVLKGLLVSLLLAAIILTIFYSMVIGLIMVIIIIDFLR